MQRHRERHQPRHEIQPSHVRRIRCRRIGQPPDLQVIGRKVQDVLYRDTALGIRISITGIRGQYDASRGMYQPPNDYRNWGDCVQRNRLTLDLGEPFIRGN